MAFEDGWAAMNLEMPSRVPRTEYSAQQHYELVSAVTGISVGVDSTPEEKSKASKAFAGSDAWNFDLTWSTLIGRGDLGQYATSMGHAVYAAGGTDYNTDIHEAFASPEEALTFQPMDKLPTHDHGELVRRFEAHYQANKANNPETVNMTGTYITCVSGLIDLFGWDMLLTAAGIDQEAFGALTNRYAAWMQQYYDALADADVPVVMIHDDIVWTAGPFIHPDWYRAYVFPNYKKYFAPILESGKKILFTSDGNFTSFVDDIADCGVHGFALEPLTDMGYIAQKYGKSHVFIGNADTRILLGGDRDAIRNEVERCMKIGKQCPGFFMAVGNHIPSNTPLDAALFYNEVYEELSRRT
jgi:hypothetical protein